MSCIPIQSHSTRLLHVCLKVLHKEHFSLASKKANVDLILAVDSELWSSENICKHLKTSEHILNTSENLYGISVINWGHPGNIWKHLWNIWKHLTSSWEKMSAQGVVMHCTEVWLSIKVTTQLKTLENSWEHRKTSKTIWYHPENNWGPTIDKLVQFGEDFNSRTEKWWWGLNRLCQTRPVPRSPEGNKKINGEFHVDSFCQRTTIYQRLIHSVLHFNSKTSPKKRWRWNLNQSNHFFWLIVSTTKSKDDICHDLGPKTWLGSFWILSSPAHPICHKCKWGKRQK